MRTDMVDMYIEVLFAFNKSLGLLEDDQLFTQYVYNIFTFLDRHWKKLVSSLRLGTLHYELPIDKKEKDIVESHFGTDAKTITVVGQEAKKARVSSKSFELNIS